MSLKDLFHRHKEEEARKKFAVILIIVVFVIIVGIWFFNRGARDNATDTQSATSTVSTQTSGNGEMVELGVLSTLDTIQKLAGFGAPKRYLVLFLNNAELRAGGGFIGSYATLRVDNARVSDLFIQGSEFVGRDAAAKAFPQAPTVLAAMMGTSRWYFRNANWSPDFPTSAHQAATLYALQTGDTQPFDGVIGITPDIVTALLELTGPVTVQGIEFTPQNVAEKIQYEVEQGYVARGLPAQERKYILRDVTQALLVKLGEDLVANLGNLLGAYHDLIVGGHVMIVSFDEALQGELDTLGWSGRVMNPTGDYLSVVDSNINSAKTDPAVKRSFMYNIREVNGTWVADLTLDYTHERTPDWRTTAYKTYTRVYVPAGSELLNAQGWRAVQAGALADINKEELGKTVFGGYFTVAPKSSRTVRLSYRLPASVGEAIAAGTYDLYVEKQLGAAGHTFNFRPVFNRPISSVEPAGTVEGAGYFQTVSLDQDRTFHVAF